MVTRMLDRVFDGLNSRPARLSVALAPAHRSADGLSPSMRAPKDVAPAGDVLCLQAGERGEAVRVLGRRVARPPTCALLGGSSGPLVLILVVGLWGRAGLGPPASKEQAEGVAVGVNHHSDPVLRLKAGQARAVGLRPVHRDG